MVLSYDDVGGGAGFVWLAVGVISCRDYGLKRERALGERKNIKIMYRKATITVHICIVTVAIVYRCGCFFG